MWNNTRPLIHSYVPPFLNFIALLTFMTLPFLPIINLTPSILSGLLTWLVTLIIIIISYTISDLTSPPISPNISTSAIQDTKSYIQNIIGTDINYLLS